MKKRQIRRFLKRYRKDRAMLLQRIEHLERNVYGGVVPDSFLDEVEAALTKPNPYRTLIRKP